MIYRISSSALTPFSAQKKRSNNNLFVSAAQFTSGGARKNVSEKRKHVHECKTQCARCVGCEWQLISDYLSHFKMYCCCFFLLLSLTLLLSLYFHCNIWIEDVDKKNKDAIKSTISYFSRNFFLSTFFRRPKEMCLECWIECAEWRRDEERRCICTWKLAERLHQVDACFFFVHCRRMQTLATGTQNGYSFRLFKWM